jgi:hypothetical protein
MFMWSKDNATIRVAGKARRVEEEGYGGACKTQFRKHA